MRGNVYISIPTADINNELPAAITRYDWTESTYNEEGAVDTSTVVHPSWQAYGEKYAKDFGAPVSVTVNDKEYIIYEMLASWKDSEVSALLALGSGKAEPNYTVMQAEEARAFIIANQEPQL